MCPLFGRSLAHGLSLWLSLAQLPRGKKGPSFSVFVYAWPICLSFGSVLPMGWLSGSRSLSSRKEGHSFAVFVYFLRMCPSVGSQLAPGLALWLSLSERPGGILSLFSLMFDLFVHYLGRDLPLGWLSGSRSLSSQGGWVGGRGGGPCLYSLMSDEFCLHLARGLPLGWLSGSCSLSSQREPFLRCFRSFLTYLSITWVVTCPWGLSFWLSLAELPGGGEGASSAVFVYF